MTTKKSTEKFIFEASKKHNNKYDYSKTEYKNNKTKLTIICPEHGEFEQRGDKHLIGEGCPKCGGTQKKTTELFIAESIKFHGIKYDYSKSVYINYKTKLIIICPEHGEFEQTPHAHLHQYGCKKCSLLKRDFNKKFNINNFIEKAIKKHDNKYDYSKSIYINAKTKLTIICSEHGEFEQRPFNHLRGDGCSKCNGGIKLNLIEFIEKSKLIHGDKYDYSLTEYKNNRTKIKIICPEHGEFKQDPSRHLSGSGCSICSKNKPLSLNEFLEKAKEKHCNKYDYSKSEFINVSHKIIIICPEHGEFEQKVANHLFGQCCPHCKTSQGENNIKLFLKQNDIEFIQQKTFDGCIDMRMLKFDFYLPKYNICIEYDGIQHFKPVRIFGGDEEFLKIKNRDKIKNKFCIDNNIHMLRISYKEKNVNKIINNFILELK